MAGKVQYFGNVVSAPAWMGDFGSRDHLLPFPAKVDPAVFSDQSAVVIKTTALASAAATTIAVTALAYPFNPALTIVSAGNVLIPKGTVIYFGAGLFARLSADAVIGATSLTVEALVADIASGSTANYSPFGGEVILSGTIVGRTWAQRDANSPFIPAIAGTHDEIFIVAFDVPNAKFNSDVVLYRPPSVVKENYLPGYSTVLAPGGTPSSLMTALRGIYRCIKGVN